MPERFQDRYEAGQVLAHRLAAYARRPDVIVLALPRGGLPVGVEVARGLAASLDVFLVRKLGVPGQEELAMGAIASGGVSVINREVVEMYHIPQSVIAEVVAAEQHELARREHLYRGDRPPPAVAGQTVILVDDGLATGSSMRAALAALHTQSPAWLVVAVPVAAQPVCQALSGEANEVVCVLTPDPFYAVGLWYENFSQISDDDVRRLLQQSPQ